MIIEQKDQDVNSIAESNQGNRLRKDKTLLLGRLQNYILLNNEKLGLNISKT